WRDGHTHLYLYSFDKTNPLAAEAKLENQVTKGEFEVFGVAGIDEGAGTVYVNANPGDDREHHLCSVKLDGSSFQVLTRTQPGTHTVNLSPHPQNYLDQFSPFITPPPFSFF